MPTPLKIDWLAIEQAVSAGLCFEDAAIKFNVKSDTIRKRASRHKWVLPKHVAVAVRAKAEIAVQRAAENWLEKGEQHRVDAFKIAHESVKKFKVKAPKNFRELEAADKIARRAAGLDTGEVHVQTLINLNERVNAFGEDAQPIEADSVVEVEVEATVVPSEPPDLPNTSSSPSLDTSSPPSSDNTEPAGSPNDESENPVSSEQSSMPTCQASESTAETAAQSLAA